MSTSISFLFWARSRFLQATSFLQSLFLQQLAKLFTTETRWDGGVISSLYSLLGNITDDAQNVTKFSTISLYLTKLYVTQSFAVQRHQLNTAKPAKNCLTVNARPSPIYYFPTKLRESFFLQHNPGGKQFCSIFISFPGQKHQLFNFLIKETRTYTFYSKRPANAKL